MIPWRRLRTLFRQPRKVVDNYRARLRYALVELRRDWYYHGFRCWLRIYRKLSGRKIVVLVRHGGIGDVICTFPAVKALRDSYPGAFFVYAIWPVFRDIVKMGKVADGILPLVPGEYRTRLPRDEYDVLYELRLEEEEPQGRPFVHLTEDFARGLNVCPASMQPTLEVPRTELEAMDGRLGPLRHAGRPIVGIHVGPTWKVKEWLPAHWTELVEQLKANSGGTVVQLGADLDTTRGPQASTRIPGAIDWVGQLDLSQTCAAIAEMDLFIGVDSGLLHVAGAVGTPVIGLFGPTDPRKLLPPESTSAAVTSSVPCLGCHHRAPRFHWQTGCPHDIACMRELSPAAVAAEAMKLFKVAEAAKS